MAVGEVATREGDVKLQPPLPTGSKTSRGRRTARAKAKTRAVSYQPLRSPMPWWAPLPRSKTVLPCVRHSMQASARAKARAARTAIMSAAKSKGKMAGRAEAHTLPSAVPVDEGDPKVQQQHLQEYLPCSCHPRSRRGCRYRTSHMLVRSKSQASCRCRNLLPQLKRR